MSPNDFYEMLTYIAKDIIRNESKLNEYSRYGININDWPEIKISELLKNYLSVRESKGHSVAYNLLGREIKRYDVRDFTLEEIETNYLKEITAYKARDLANRLYNDPYNLEEIINNYKETRTCNLKLTPVSKIYNEVVSNHLMKTSSGDTRVILPGFEKLSKAINGFNSEMISIISASSGFGKTKLALNLASSASKIMKVIFFNMELTTDQFVAQIIHKNAKINNDDWFDGSFITQHNKELILKDSENKDHENFLISDGSTNSLTEIINAIYFYSNGNPQFIVVDYDQKIKMPGKKTEWEEILEAVVKLEDTAKKTNSHIILLAQANEEGQVRASSRALQPASNLLNFKKDSQGRNIIQSLKTRYAKRFTLEVSYDQAKSIITEVDFVKEEPIAPVKQKKKSNPLF